MASLLIIGGSGFFGKSILDAYRRGLLNFWGIDSIGVLARNAHRLSEQFPELIDDSIRLIDSDIATCHELPVADYVIHAAASTDAANYLLRPEAEKNNIQAGTYNYCELAKKFHRNSHIVYCSSGAVYGQQPADLEYLTEEFHGGDVNEMPPVKRDYAAAKRDGEKAIQLLGRDGLNTSIARCFAFVGKYLPRDQHFAIGNFIQDGLDGSPILVKADQFVYRSYMHSDELVEWLMTILSSASINCPIFNVGSDEEIQIDNLASQIGNRFGVDVVICNERKSGVDRYIPSITKARMLLNLKCKWSLSEAIEKTIVAIQNEKTN